MRKLSLSKMDRTPRYGSAEKMMQNTPYQAYAEGVVASSSPTALIIELYKAALDAVRKAEDALREGDILGRSRAVTKGFEILTELLLSLNPEKAPEMSANLQRLYSYMQQRLLSAHARAEIGPLQEVERLLTTLAEAWEVVARETIEAERKAAELEAFEPRSDREDPAYKTGQVGYGGYYREPIESLSGLALSC